MNPFGWKRAHFIAWLILCALGGVIGLLYGYSQSPYATDGGRYFLVWLADPSFYWHWPTFGVLIAGLAFYAIQLLTSSN